jgi:hypothetical protein
MDINASFFDVLYEVQRNLHDVSAGKGIFRISYFRSFSEIDIKVGKVNFPGKIRVNNVTKSDDT